MLSEAETWKQAAAEKAVEQVSSGMTVGLGTGSTARYAVARIGALYASGALREIRAVATSGQTARQAQALNLPLHELGALGHIDVAIDGADEVDPALNLVKGGGGAMLREKQVERLAERFLVVVDESKLVAKLCTRAPLPIEVSPGAREQEAAWLATRGMEPRWRHESGQACVTDNGNHILDCHFVDGLDEPRALAAALDARPNVLAHGLFLDMATQVIVGGADGIRLLERP